MVPYRFLQELHVGWNTLNQLQLPVVLCVLQAINDASKAAISSVQHDRTQLSEQLQRMQDEFIQASALFNAEVRSLQAELLAFFSSGTDVLGCLQQCSSDARRVQAAQAAQAVGAGAAARVGDAAGQDAALDAWE